MQNVIELAKALGYPIAIVIAAICFLVVIFKITSNKGSMKIGVKDWINFETDPSDSQKISNEKVGTPENESLASPSSDKEIDANEDETPASSVEGATHFIFAENVEGLESSFEIFRNTDSFKNDPDFWHSTYVDKRREMGVGDEEVELRQLAEANPEWVWPLIYLIRRYVRLHEAGKAEDCLQQAMGRSSEENARFVLREGIAYYAKLFGFERAFQFFVQNIQEKIPDRDVAAMLRSLVKFAPSDDIFETIIYKEIASSLDFDKEELFDIAYAYGEVADLKIVSFERYRELYWKDKDYISAANNMGVIITDDRAVESEYFEKAISTGDPIAHANLSRNLASAGYVARAEKLLADAPSENLSSEAESALADAKAKVGTARKKLDEDLGKLEEHARNQDAKYKSLIFAAFAYLKEFSGFEIEGLFLSKDHEIGIFGGAEVRAGMKVGDERYFGSLESKGLCYEGTIRRKGATILDFSDRRIVAARVSIDEVRVLLFPNGFGLDRKSRVVSLYRAAREESVSSDEAVSIEQLLQNPDR